MLPRLISVAAAALVVGGFFAPWMEGAGPLDLRTFSGFDFARLMRNFEIAADSAAETGGVRGAALALYLAPALAVNGALLHQLRGFEIMRAAGGPALIAGGAYAAWVLAVVLLLSQAPVNDFERVVGTPSWGYGLTAVGAAALVAVGLTEVRSGR